MFVLFKLFFFIWFFHEPARCTNFAVQIICFLFFINTVAVASFAHYCLITTISLWLQLWPLHLAVESLLLYSGPCTAEHCHYNSCHTITKKLMRFHTKRLTVDLLCHRKLPQRLDSNFAGLLTAGQSQRHYCMISTAKLRLTGPFLRFASYRPWPDSNEWRYRRMSFDWLRIGSKEPRFCWFPPPEATITSLFALAIARIKRPIIGSFLAKLCSNYWRRWSSQQMDQSSCSACCWLKSS